LEAQETKRWQGILVLQWESWDDWDGLCIFEEMYKTPIKTL
jgi:hypothetical protein